MLLGQDEFAVSLISHADERVTNRADVHNPARPVRKIGKLDDLNVKEAELSGIVNKTLAEIALVSAEDDQEDDTFNLAKKLLCLRAAAEPSDPSQIATLLPTQTLLQLTISAHSPLHMFLSAENANMYATTNAYLLLIHRAELHLSNL